MSNKKLSTGLCGSGCTSTAARIQYSATCSVKISEGPLKGQVIYAQNIYESSMYGSFLVSPGDKVFVYVIMDNGKVTDAYIQDLDRLSGTISTVLIFSLIVLLIAHLKGLDALLGLFLTGLFMWKMSIPMIAHGENPLVVGILTVMWAQWLL